LDHSGRTGHRFACAGDDTILRAALRAGFGFPYECNTGSCGTCRFELIEGEVVHERAEPPGWTELDRRRLRYLGCQARPAGDCMIKVRLDPGCVSRHRPRRLRARVRELLDLTHDMREFRLDLETPHRFRPGQYALFMLPGVSGRRAYSMCNVTATGAEWHFQIKLVPGGQATPLLFREARVGAPVELDGPHGMAHLHEASPRDVLCIAGGSGLSPMISIVRAAAASLPERQIHLVYGGRTPRDICGEPILAELDGFGTRIHSHPAISMADERGTWRGRVGMSTKSRTRCSVSGSAASRSTSPARRPWPRRRSACCSR
jgi:toluene monooxygenase electron transfer component